jgi:hypothetical protein
VRADAEMNAKLFRALVDSEGRRVESSGGALGDDFDGNMFASYDVLGLEDHTEGAMIERRDSFVSSIENNTLVKLVAQALHK